MSATIRQFPLTPSFIITVFDGRGTYGIHKGGGVTECNGKYSHVDFMNSRLSFPAHYMVNEVNEGNSKKILDAAGIVPDTLTNLEFMTDYLRSNGWTFDIDKTRIIVPKPDKNLTGKKLTLEFELITPDFKGTGNYDLDVYMSAITRTSKTVKFSVNVPKYIYDKCMEDTDVNARPTRSYIEEDTISTLFNEMWKFSNQAREVVKLEKQADNSEKVLCINFNSSEFMTRDELNHAYTGQKIKTEFNFFVAYNMKNAGLTRYTMFTTKKYKSGIGTTNTETGIIDTGKSKNFIANKPMVIIPWTQERENFLTKLEKNFKDLSDNLNLFLKDITADKLEHLIANAGEIKLLNQ